MILQRLRPGEIGYRSGVVTTTEFSRGQNIETGGQRGIVRTGDFGLDRDGTINQGLYFGEWARGGCEGLGEKIEGGRKFE